MKNSHNLAGFSLTILLSVLLCFSHLTLAEQTNEKKLQNRQSRNSERKLNSSDSAINKEAVKKLRQVINEKYSYRDLRNVDWRKLFETYTPRLEQAKTPHEFAELAAKMLANAKDMHLWVKIDNETIGGFRRNIQRNYNIDLLKKQVPNFKDLSQYVSMGRYPDNIGYILIESWENNEAEVLEPALKALKDLTETKALIIDVRPNGGGAEPLAQKFAGCFINQPAVYSKNIYRNINEPNGWTKVFERKIKPNPDQPAYKGKIVVLMGQANISSCESFLLMMKQVSNCKLIGEKSGGSSGNPKPYDLGNGVTVWLPSWKDLRPDGTCLESQGIKPDINIVTNQKLLKEKDTVLDAALKYCGSNHNSSRKLTGSLK